MTVNAFFLLFAIIVGVFLTNILIRSKSGLRVLMYHKISLNTNDNLTISEDVLEKQLLYLKEKNYHPITVQQLIEHQYQKAKLPKKPILLTFDDGYENNYTYLYPLLKKHALKATIFLPVGFIGKSNEWDEGDEAIMSFDRLKQIDSSFIEFGLHSLIHRSYKEFTTEELIDDISQCRSILTENSIPYVPAVTYPYGAYPREQKIYEKFKETLINNEIQLGFRIGNRINKLPLADPFCIERIDIKGTDSFFRFKLKILLGRIKKL
ncbi:polysaccharide deacetylase [Paludibacter propionicigenes WB4]|uniref:Polysaccharide deacetylase n=2 Tax=Paludibacter TaxID=346096 RepID=E4T5U5_PALPW|nr:polysaccharide deacetylase [Paludibacter propionicigenes WB4]